MRKDNIARRLIKYRNKEIRHRVSRLPHIWWLVIILLAAVVLLTVSYFTYLCAPWFSGVLVSASCGCFTGVAFYFLANIRNNKEQKIQKEYLALKQTYDLVMVALSYGDYYKFYKKMWLEKRSAFEAGFELLSLLDEIENARNQIDLSVYDTVTDLGYDPLDRDNLDSYREKLNSSEDEVSMEFAILEICKELLPAADKLRALLLERDDQLTFMGSHFL